MGWGLDPEGRSRQLSPSNNRKNKKALYIIYKYNYKPYTIDK
nr:MAG TPA: hypothetical protein [Caudoviricetes sp.]